MSKSSTVTVRERPVEEVASANVGGLTIHGETIVIQTDQRIELVDLTNRVMEFARRFNIREGLVSLWSMHTTCALFINEFQTALLTDIKRFLEQMVARDAEWMHNNPEHSDCDRMNADSHLRAPARPQPHAAGQRRRSRAGSMAADPDGRARRPARPLPAHTDVWCQKRGELGN
jgi:secondary thiamine-phosphate synthase enzyme